MTKIEKLTPEQEAMMGTIRDKWIQFALYGGDDLDVKTATESINWLYHRSKLAQPVVLVVDSPLAVQYATTCAKELINILSNKKMVRDQVGTQVGAQVWAQVGDQVWAQVGAQVGDQVRDQVWAQVGDQVRDQVWAQVGAQVRAQVGAQVGATKMPIHDTTYDDLAWQSGWMAWAEFFENMGVIKNDDLKKYKKYLKSGVFYGVFLDGLAVVCSRPKFISRDARNLLDSDHQAAIEWKDGFKLHYLHGVHFDEATWKKIVNQEITLETLGEITNADQRAVAVQMLKPELLLKQVKAKLIHTGIKGTRLYEVPNFMDTGDTEYCMRMKHPSLKTEYLEWVEPSIGKQGDADVCQANAFGIPLEDYLLMVEA